MSQKHTISVLVENHFGVLARISTLISARGFNIDSLTVSATEDPTASRMTIVVDADALKLEQVKRQLGRLIDVIEVKELKDEQFIGRDLLLARVSANGKAKAQLEQLVGRYGGKIAEATEQVVVVEAVQKAKVLDELIEQLRPYGIIKLVRAGRVALERE
jgi:acetolactate synthase-1/3 small subunit